jgi:membrane protease YdiL (CAAX protease family)
MTAELERPERSRRWRELGIIYLIMTLGTVGVDQLANVWPLFSSISVLIVALGFIFLPTEWLLSRGESPHLFGIGGRADKPKIVERGSQRAWRCTKQALWISALIFPLFILGNHAWRGLNGQEVHPSSRAFTRWDEQVRGLSNRSLSSGEVNLSASSDRIKLKWRLKPNERTFTAQLRIDAQAKVISKSRNIKVIPPKSDQRLWQISGARQGYILFTSPAYQLDLQGKIDQKVLPLQRYSWGEYHNMSDQIPPLTRHFEWLWSIFFIQLFLVGLPEEIFYRGYLQTRLDSLVGRDQLVFGVAFNWTSTILCSGLFALAHIATIPHPARLAVFFPSLLFGWMRRAYSDTLTPAIFHALCNVLSQILWGMYALGA